MPTPFLAYLYLHPNWKCTGNDWGEHFYDEGSDFPPRTSNCYCVSFYTTPCHDFCVHRTVNPDSGWSNNRQWYYHPFPCIPRQLYIQFGHSHWQKDYAWSYIFYILVSLYFHKFPVHCNLFFTVYKISIIQALWINDRCCTHDLKIRWGLAIKHLPS